MPRPAFYDLQFYPFDGPTSDASVFALAGDEYVRRPRGSATPCSRPMLTALLVKVIVASIDQDARLEALRVIKEVPLHASQVRSRPPRCCHGFPSP